MIRDLDELENSIASQFRFDRYYRTVFAKEKYSKVLGPKQVGYLARCCYKNAIRDLLEYIEGTKSPELLRFRLKQIKEDYA